MVQGEQGQEHHVDHWGEGDKTREPRKEEGWQRHILDKVEDDRKNNQKQKGQNKLVIFVPETKHSESAKRLREHEKEMEKHTGYKI